jgi:acetylornithine deacetylase/succinyl-diaminopimelate desuccinylase family protein
MIPDILTGILADLVSIPSVNPMGRAGAGAAFGEAGVADYVASFLRHCGVDAELQEVMPGRPNVIGVLDAGAPATLLLEAHLDTVRVDTMTIPPFTPVIREGKLHGRGACDTKGSLAAFLHAVCTAATAGGRRRWNIVFVAATDEEYQFSGARHAVAHGLKADMGIAGEPTGLAIVRAHKGVTRWKITTAGLAAHSAYPDRGDNAIYTMGHVITRLEGYAEGLEIGPAHPVLGRPSFSVGVIGGGEAVNIVPDRCVIEVDRRTLPGESTERILEDVRRVLGEVPGWTFEPPHVDVRGMDVPEESPVVGHLSAAIREITGSVRIETAHYATDAGMYNAAGIPTVVFGPGDIARAHTADEWIELESVYNASSIIRRLVDATPHNPHD